MENRKGSGIFLGVIGVATLIVAIIGATFAFFGANAAGGEQAVAAGSAVLKLGFHEEVGGLKHNLIPSTPEIALFAATNEGWIADEKHGICVDQNNNEVCGVYEFAIGNPSLTTAQNIYGSIKIASTDFTNLYFRIIDETGADVVAPKNFSTAVDGIIELEELNQVLAPAPTGVKDTFDDTNPLDYPRVCTVGEQFTPAGSDTARTCTKEDTNVREFKLILWIQELGTDQTEADSGKTFAAGISFSSAKGNNGVTGVISAAEMQKYTGTGA